MLNFGKVYSCKISLLFFVFHETMEIAPDVNKSL